MRLRLLLPVAAGLTALAAALAGGLTPAATAAQPVLDGVQVAPVVVSEAGVRWLPWDRMRLTAGAARTTALVTAPTAANATAQHAGSYAFMATGVDGSPVRWNPCTPVHWSFNPAHAPSGGLAAVQSALQRVSSATGLSFVYDGTTGTVPTGSYLDGQSVTAPLPLLIGWSTPAESSLLANQPSTLVGMDRSMWFRDGTGATYITSGVVALNSLIHAGTTGANSWYTYALHELGHAVGLGHTSDSTQIMSPVIPAAAGDYGSGDLSGLRRVGGSC
jgi:hypothetical protein